MCERCSVIQGYPELILIPPTDYDISNTLLDLCKKIKQLVVNVPL